MGLYRIVIGATLFPALKGEVRHLRNANRQKRGKFAAPIGSFHGFIFIRCASPIGGERIAGPIVLVLHKGNERIGEERTTIPSALPIVIELPSNFPVLTGNRNMFNMRKRRIKT
jgi:hypothetical protein